MTSQTHLIIRAWLQKMTPNQRQLICGLLGYRSEALLRQLSADRDNLGAKTASAELAAKIERAVHKARQHDRAIPPIRRDQISPVCAACPHAPAWATHASSIEAAMSAADADLTA